MKTIINVDEMKKSFQAINLHLTGYNMRKGINCVFKAQKYNNKKPLLLEDIINLICSLEIMHSPGYGYGKILLQWQGDQCHLQIEENANKKWVKCRFSNEFCTIDGTGDMFDKMRYAKRHIYDLSGIFERPE